MRLTALTCLAASLACGPARAFDARALFDEPVALRAPDGSPLVTGKAHTCPFAVDWSGDGHFDLIIGAKENMRTDKAGVWLLRNLGTTKRPAFDLARAIRVRTGGNAFSCGTG